MGQSSLFYSVIRVDLAPTLLFLNSASLEVFSFSVCGLNDMRHRMLVRKRQGSLTVKIDQIFGKAKIGPRKAQKAQEIAIVSFGTSQAR